MNESIAMLIYDCLTDLRDRAAFRMMCKSTRRFPVIDFDRKKKALEQALEASKRRVTVDRGPEACMVVIPVPVAVADTNKKYTIARNHDLLGPLYEVTLESGKSFQISKES